MEVHEENAPSIKIFAERMGLVGHWWPLGVPGAQADSMVFIYRVLHP